jgi:hypothetical protein
MQEFNAVFKYHKEHVRHEKEILGVETKVCKIYILSVVVPMHSTLQLVASSNGGSYHDNRFLGFIGRRPPFLCHRFVFQDISSKKNGLGCQHA